MRCLTSCDVKAGEELFMDYGCFGSEPQWYHDMHIEFGGAPQWDHSTVMKTDSADNTTNAGSKDAGSQTISATNTATSAGQFQMENSVDTPERVESSPQNTPDSRRPLMSSP